MDHLEADCPRGSFRSNSKYILRDGVSFRLGASSTCIRLYRSWALLEPVLLKLPIRITVRDVCEANDPKFCQEADCLYCSARNNGLGLLLAQHFPRLDHGLDGAVVDAMKEAPANPSRRHSA
jgi:hypothetical protein